MTLASAIIASAYRELNVVALNDTPTAAELAEALPRLQTYVDSVYGYELGENLMDWMVPAPQRTAPFAANFPQLPYPLSADSTMLPFPLASDPAANMYLYPPQNSRIVWGGTSATTVYFPEAPNAGARMGLVVSGGYDGSSVLTFDGNGKLIGTGAGTPQSVQPTPVVAARWVFRDDTGIWVPVTTNFAATDPMPFPEAFDDFFIVALAIRLAPRYNKNVAAESQKAGMDALKRLKARYRQDGTTVYGSNDFPRSLQSYISGKWYY